MCFSNARQAAKAQSFCTKSFASVRLCVIIKHKQSAIVLDEVAGYRRGTDSAYPRRSPKI